MRYEMLLSEAFSEGIHVSEEYIEGNRIKGLYSDNVIWISDKLKTNTEKYCVLAEELGHYHTTEGDIIDQSPIVNRKQELRARLWAYEKAVSLSKVIQAHKLYIRNKFELADYLGVTEYFLEKAIERYKEIHGLTVNHNGYTICFEPLGVIEWFE
ncbi:ImmA/IrrE family metallo-endopeptidase [Oceanobacillus kapialis]|uniref:ImmA/IrrE family metallo-endopeptidase n=1 Tax=Oceanobacillus kapialis TaxID=481353 RepID=A0ABW5Q019_9BACI